jgi:hydroxymethylglutaryl-CoA lyase
VIRLPRVERLDGLPARVSIYEVGPRDGLQNEAAVVPVEVKAQFVERLVAAGLRTVEVTSFVHPSWVPQLADAEALIDLIGPVDRGDSTRMPVLVPNEAGLARAMAKRVRDIAIFASATETFAARNLNRTLDSQFAMFEPVVRRAKDEGLWVRGYLSMCFGDPWEGEVAVSQVVAVARRLLDLGCDELSLGDTIGVATPGHVSRLLGSLVEAGTPIKQVAVHFHDTYGQALSNALTALRHGVTTVDSSAGGLGGCPYAESATGNLATEDLVWQLHGLGIETGVDLEALAATTGWMAAQIGKPPASRVATALLGSAS